MALVWLNFYPRSPRGERHPARTDCPAYSYFYPRSPRGERPYSPRGRLRPKRFLSTLPARGATLLTAREVKAEKISIHAPREGSDSGAAYRPAFYDLFLSTLPARGATCFGWPRKCKGRFLSTLPARGATQQFGGILDAHTISIHAPREGSDRRDRDERRATTYFYPRSPRGERRRTAKHRPGSAPFLSTLPARGATGRFDFYHPMLAFLSTLPARGATVHTSQASLAASVFLSTLPARGATALASAGADGCKEFLSTLPARGATDVFQMPNLTVNHFYPRSPRGERPVGA